MKGNDYLCAIMARKKGLGTLCTGVYYPRTGRKLTEGELQLMETGTMEVEIESNNGGRAFARNVQRIASERGYRASIRWFHQRVAINRRVF